MKATGKISLRALLTVWFTLLMAAIVALVCVFICLVDKDTVDVDMRQTLVTRVDRNVRQLEPDEDGLEIDDDFRYEKDGVCCAILRSEADVFLGQLPIDAAAYPLNDGAVQTVTVGEVEYYIYDRYQPLRVGGVWVRGIAPRIGTVSSVSTLAKLALFILPLVVLLAAAGGWFLSGLALRPLKKVSAAVDEISGGDDLSRRIDERGAPKEVFRIAHSFNGMFARLEDAFRREKQFTSDVSHELRTPTAVILAESEYALASAKDDSAWRESAETVQRQAKRMSALIGQLLSFTRLEQGTAKVEKQRIDLAELAEAVTEEQDAVNPAHAKVTARLEREVFVSADLTLMTRLLTNLVSNACKFGSTAVCVSLCRRDDQAELSVRDNGIGIEESEQARIFDRFYQVSSARTAEDGGSSGLGLAMVRQIAALHGGAVTVKSAPGEGSTFTFRMPLAQ